MLTHFRNSYITNKELMSFFIASVLNVLIIQINTFIDNVILGHYIGADAISAISLCSPFFNVTMTLPVIVAMGATLLSAKLMGMQQHDAVGRYFTVTLFTSIAFCLFVTSVLLASDSLVPMMIDDNRLLPLVEDYLPWIGFVSLCFSIQNAYTYFLTLIGKSRLVVIVSFLQMIINLGLDIVMVGVLGYGMAGAAIATGVGYMVSLIVVIPAIRSNSAVFRLQNPFTRWFPATLWKSLGYGLASGLDSLYLAALTLVVNGIALSVYGADGVFVFSIFLQMMAVCSLVTEGAGDTIETLGSVFYGERDITGYRFLYHNVMAVSMIFVLAIFTLMCIVPDVVCMLFGADARLAAYSVTPLRILSFILIPHCLLYLVSCGMLVVSRPLLSISMSLGATVTLIVGVFMAEYLWPDALWASMTLAILVYMVFMIVVMMLIHRRDKTLEWYSLISKFGNIPNIDFSVLHSDKNVADAENQIRVFLRICELPEEMTNRVQTCVAEIMRNIQNRHVKKQRGRYFDIRVNDMYESTDCRIKVFVKDYGSAFNPLANSDSCTDSEYHYRNGVNCTVLTF